MMSPDDVLRFWLDEVGPKGWYEADDALDAEIRERFLGAWENARDGACAMWLTYPSGTLAYIILTDQFPRNMFRGEAHAFETDRAALTAAKVAINRGWDMKIDEPARQFFYLPLMHSENLCDQDRCVRLICERMPEHGVGNLLHARAHREVIRRFGRFPYRNATLGRASTAPERAFEDEGGYGALVRRVRQAA
ncbi:DUF924 family protein [Roseovarius autotrophicus]|uniref:DUF924 family protein n=1 Tax=Roseovarius autotrophicus TaxID=2824121 RepID=UPI001A0FF4CA|nr:DUF924 family protein [Roseovarius autotrophicus]MBE0453892.1 DUF924 domain-containing protein [Roseovarius sp.]